MKRKLIIGLLVLVAALLVFLVIFFAIRPSVEAGAKTVTVEVVHADGSHKEFTCHTDMEYLGELLLSEGLVQGEEGEYGLYITRADGEDAIKEMNGAYWALYENDVYATQGADMIPLKNGSSFMLIYTTD